MTVISKFDQDYSAASIEILSGKVKEIFSSQVPNSQVWIPDSYEWPVFNKKLPVDIVFFGDFFRKFLESGNWTPREYRFWCLGTPTAKFFTEIVGLRPTQVSVIPRNFFFNTHSLPDGFELQKSERHLIYAGRLTPSKRILTMIWTTYFLQKMGIEVDLSLYGEFLSEEKFCDCPGPNPYEDKVKSLLTSLDWKRKPRLQGKVDAKSWLKQNSSAQKVYFSLSVLPFEDFSVSVAQAQENAWPCILTNWGAHKDVSGSVLRLPMQMLESLYETEDSAQREGKAIAEYISRKSFSLVPEVPGQLVTPEIITSSEIDGLRRNFLEKWGMNLQDVIRHRTVDLKKSENWNAFMKEYVKCFL